MGSSACRCVFSTIKAIFCATVWFSTGWLDAARAEPAQSSQQCAPCYRAGDLTILEKPNLIGDEEVCATGELVKKALVEKCKFLKLPTFYGVPEGASALIELDTADHYVVHLVRDKYYGEFIDRTVTEIGASKRDLSLILAGEAARTKDASALTYYYIIEDYEWSSLRVVSFRRKYQRVRLDGEGRTVPLDEVITVNGVRHLATIIVSESEKAVAAPLSRMAAPLPLSEQQIEISLYYEDPLFMTPRFFRSFPLLSDKQRTALQFVSDGQGGFRPAILRVHRGAAQYGEIRVSKPEEEEISLNVKLN